MKTMACLVCAVLLLAGPAASGAEQSGKVRKNPALSRYLSQLGWSAYYAGDSRGALERFDRAWRFDPKNADAYWGAGLALSRLAPTNQPEPRLKESIRFLEKARDLKESDGRIAGDLAFMYAQMGNYFQQSGRGKEAQKQFKKAGRLFERTFRPEPAYAGVAANWSVFCFYQGAWAGAKAKADQAAALGFPVSPDYLKELNARLHPAAVPAAAPAVAEPPPAPELALLPPLPGDVAAAESVPEIAAEPVPESAPEVAMEPAAEEPAVAEIPVEPAMEESPAPGSPASEEAP